MDRGQDLGSFFEDQNKTASAETGSNLAKLIDPPFRAVQIRKIHRNFGHLRVETVDRARNDLLHGVTQFIGNFDSAPTDIERYR
jgi:hypothetical protein